MIFQDYEELQSGKISKLRPFGETLHYGLENSRFDNITGYAMWVEEDYCSPPLAMEKESVLDRYFTDNSYSLKIISKKYGLGSVTNRPTTNFLVY
jgi:hypothetical protein